MNQTDEKSQKPHWWRRILTVGGILLTLKWIKEGFEWIESIAGWGSGDNEGNVAKTIELAGNWLKMNMPWMLTFIDKIAPPLGLVTLAGVCASFCVEKWRARQSPEAVGHQPNGTVPVEQPKKTLGEMLTMPHVATAEFVAASAVPTSTSVRTRFEIARENFSRHKPPENKGDGLAKTIVRTGYIEPITLFGTRMPDPVPDLKIEYEKANHLTKDPSGLIQFRLRIMNNGTVPVRGPKVSLKSLSPLAQAKKLSPYTTQFNDVPLRFAKPELAAVINPGDGLEVFVCFLLPKFPTRLFFSGTDTAFDLPRGKFLASILATAENAKPTEQKFEINASGATLAIKRSQHDHNEPKIPVAKNQSPPLYELPFDRPLAASDWKPHVPDESKAPKYRVIPAAVGQPISLDIELHADNPIVHDVPHELDAKKVEIVGKLIRSKVYIRCAGLDDKKIIQRRLWLQIAKGTNPPQKDSNSEWIIWCQPKISKSGGWETITVSLPKAFKDTFGTEGYSFVGVNGFSFRGNLVMSKIIVQ